MASTKHMEQFEISKQEFIQTVRRGYEKFLKDNGIDLEGEIRAKVLHKIKQKKAKKQEKKLEKKQENDLQESYRLVRLGIISDMLYDVENKFVDKVQEFYGDLVDVEIISEWYYNDCNVTINIMWDDKTLDITNYDGVLKISGGKKELRKYIKSDKDLVKEFLDASDEYYYLNDEYYTSSSKNSE